VLHGDDKENALAREIAAIADETGWVPSGDLIDYLVHLPERPWGEANRGKQINERWLARKLDPIKPGRFRDQDEKQIRGYKVADLQDAIERFLTLPDLSGQVSHTRQNGISQASQEVSQDTPAQVSRERVTHTAVVPDSVTDAVTLRKADSTRLCDAVTLKTPEGTGRDYVEV